MKAEDLEALLSRVLAAPSPFYRRRLEQAGITSAARLTADAWARVPPTRRAELLRDQLDHLPHGTRRFADAGHPVRAGVSGSGDDLLVLTWTAADLARERAAGTRLLRRLGIAAGMRVANTLPGALVTPGSLLLGDVIEDIGALDVPLGAIENEAAAKAAWELIDRVQPGVLVLEAPQATRLFAAAPPAERDWLRGLIWLRRGAEAVDQPSPPAALGFEGWQRTWLAVAEATSFVAASCSASSFHVDEGVIAEVIDGVDGTAIAAGAEGELALTLLGFDTPLVRYACCLRVRAAGGACPCGQAGAVIDVG
jgi:phenylacetate-coenzyme A ligase PaaK-like adenylate-forming protein